MRLALRTLYTRVLLAGLLLGLCVAPSSAMLLLSSTSDLIRVTTSGAVNTDVHASWVDLNGSTVTPGRTNTLISTATTTTVVGSPASSTARTVKSLIVRNRDVSTSQTVTVLHSDGTNIPELLKVTLLAGESLIYDEAAGWKVLNTLGQGKSTVLNGGSGAAVNATNLVVLASDVTNNNATANTIADVTGLSFSVTAGETYFFRATIQYTAAATTTGSRWSVNGPASPTRLNYKSEYALTTTTNTVNEGVSAYDSPAASNATSAATGANTAEVYGFITPSANGTVVIRFASEVSSSAIVAKAGSLLEWYRVL